MIHRTLIHTTNKGSNHVQYRTFPYHQTPLKKSTFKLTPTNNDNDYKKAIHPHLSINNIFPIHDPPNTNKNHQPTPQHMSRSSVVEQRRNAVQNSQDHQSTASIASVKNKIDINIQEPSLPTRPLEGDDAEEAAEKYISIIDHNIRSTFQSHLYGTEQIALNDLNFDKIDDDDVREAGSIWGSIARPVPLPPMIQSQALEDSIAYSTR